MAVGQDVLDKTDVVLPELRRRLNDLKGVTGGWATDLQDTSYREESYGDALDPDGLDWLAGQFAEYFDLELETPFFCPVPDGNLAGEWVLGRYRVSLEVDLEARSAEWVSVNVQTLKSTARQLNLGKGTDWDWINAEIRHLMLGEE